jgi:hypothetical protein
VRRRVLGVDFSGAWNAGKLIWIAEGAAVAGGLALIHCIPARDLPGGGVARDAALAALVAYVAAAGDAAVGLDFPFSLPARFIGDSDWSAWAAGFRRRYRDAEAFRAALREAAGGRELRRDTDDEAKTPFSPWNLRLYRQTWHGIADVLSPLAANDAARIAPMQPALPGRPVLLETCPASLLKHLGLYRPYKGRGKAERDQREAILDALHGLRLLVPPEPGLRDALVGNVGGDALDALLAAICAMRYAADDAALGPRPGTQDAIEARVYF